MPDRAGIAKPAPARAALSCPARALPQWAQAARLALARGPTAMVSVIAADGSAPRGAGTRMIVTGDDLSGTIGGGRLEWLALEQARKMLALAPGSWRVQDYPLGPLLGQCCGGRVRLLVERLDPARAGWLEELEPARCLVTHLGGTRLEREVAASREPTPIRMREQDVSAGASLVEIIAEPRLGVLLFGGGHVGQAIMRAGVGLPLDIRTFDTRPGHADGAIPVTEQEAEALAREARTEEAVLVLTHDHALDYRLVRAALEGDARFVGLIGSATKRARFLSRLAKDGTDGARLTCPIGLPSIRGKEPAVIAIAVLAQLLSLGAAA